MIINSADYILPLAIGKKLTETRFKITSYAGSSFYLNSDGYIATCAHIAKSLSEDEVLIAKNLKLNTKLLVKDLVIHDTMDFAVGRIEIRNNKFLNPIKNIPLHPGLSVQSFGFVFHEKHKEDIILYPRLMRGYITSIASNPGRIRGCRSIFEISYPSLAGFSGSPVLPEAQGPLIIGMLFNNSESSVEIHSYTEVDEDGVKSSEKISRIIEFGLAHSIDDIQHFLTQLGIRAFY